MNIMDKTADHRPILTGTVQLVISLIFFQLVWIVTVLSVNPNRLWPGLIALCLFFVVLAVISRAPMVDFMLVTIAVSIGLVIDTLFIQAGLLSFDMNLPWPGVAPFWILILWANFALILNNGLGWLQGRLKTAALLGFFGGPLSYLAGIKLGAGELRVTQVKALLILGLCWAIVTPLLLFIARELRVRTLKS